MILDESFLPQLQNGNNMRLVRGWMDILDYRCSYVIAAGFTQGLGVNSLCGRWIWSSQFHTAQTSSKSSLDYNPWWLQVVTSPRLRDEPRPCCEKATGEVTLLKEHEKKKRVHSNSASLLIYLCSSGSMQKLYEIFPRFCSLDPVSAALSSISCSTLGS